MKCDWKNCEDSSCENITTHINKHIELQKDTYACMWEGCKRFAEKQSNKYTLQAHVRKHTNDKPYKCTKCTRRYTRSDALNKHIKQHQKIEEEMDELISKNNFLYAEKKKLIIEAELEICKGNKLKKNIEILNLRLFNNIKYSKQKEKVRKRKWTNFIN